MYFKGNTLPVITIISNLNIVFAFKKLVLLSNMHKIVASKTTTTLSEWQFSDDDK